MGAQLCKKFFVFGGRFSAQTKTASADNLHGVKLQDMFLYGEYLKVFPGNSFSTLLQKALIVVLENSSKLPVIVNQERPRDDQFG